MKSLIIWCQPCGKNLLERDNRIEIREEELAQYVENHMSLYHKYSHTIQISHKQFFASDQILHDLGADES